ncbi:MAG: ECF transporter S component [Clostridia bacterium]|nr:ECF transporter S component [Clostridia bacterium]
MSVKKLAATGVLLALCLLFQLLKSISVFLTGPMVNAILIIATILVGPASGALIALCSPLFAWLLGATPVINMIPWMLPVIMLGNLAIVFVPWLLWKKNPIGGLALGSVVKACFLWLTVWYVVLPLFGAGLPAKMVATVRTTFSVTQLITALLGSVIAFIVIDRIGKHTKTN